jgi:hypothetical protein
MTSTSGDLRTCLKLRRREANEGNRCDFATGSLVQRWFDKLARDFAKIPTKNGRPDTPCPFKPDEDMIDNGKLVVRGTNRIVFMRRGKKMHQRPLLQCTTTVWMAMPPMLTMPGLKSAEVEWLRLGPRSANVGEVIANGQG